MAAGIFNPENDFWRLIEKLVDLFLLSVYWLVCSLPVFTLGPATAALYRTVARCIRGSERKSWSLFFRTFRENFKVGALTTLVVVAVGAVLFVLYTLLYQTASLNRAATSCLLPTMCFFCCRWACCATSFPSAPSLNSVWAASSPTAPSWHRPPALYDRLGAAAGMPPLTVCLNSSWPSQSPPPFWPAPLPPSGAHLRPLHPPRLGRR